MQNPAVIKRIIISTIFFAIFAVTGFFLYYTISPNATCTDKKQNQSEKGIDCGGPCSPCKQLVQAGDIVVTETAITLGGNETYDAVAKITNPNNTLGASSFKYKFILKDASGIVLAEREGTDFVLPADSKYVTELGFKIENNAVPVLAEFETSEPDWKELKDVGKPQIGVYSKNFDKIPGTEGNEADGILRNESSYDLNVLNVTIVLRSDKGEIVGINKTKKNNIRSREERDFRLTWPYQLAAPVQNVEVDVQSNVFDPNNFSYSVQ